MKPKLRFKNFNDNWITCTIKDVADVVGGGTPDTSNPKLWNGSINWFTPSEIGKSKYISNSERKITELGVQKSSAKLLPIGTILLSSRATVGEASILQNNQACTNQGFQSLIAHKNINNEFLYYLKDKYKKNMLNKAFGSTFLEISKSNIEKIKINIPTIEENIKEQEKISKTLSLLDKKIELQSRKIEDLKLFKSYTKNKLFQNGNQVIKLGKILIKWNKKNKDGSIKYVESISNKYGFISQADQFEDRNVASKDLKNYYVIEKNVFGYNPSRLNVGSLALKDNNNISVVSPLYECFTTNQNNKFMLEWFDSIYFKKGTMSKFEGGVRNTLNFTNLCEIEINLPSLELQNKYANYLSTFDKKILLEEKKLTELRNLKKGLMQSMFV